MAMDDVEASKPLKPGWGMAERSVAAFQEERHTKTL